MKQDESRQLAQKEKALIIGGSSSVGLPTATLLSEELSGSGRFGISF
jgi:hypothetical protein